MNHIFNQKIICRQNTFRLSKIQYINYSDSYKINSLLKYYRQKSILLNDSSILLFVFNSSGGSKLRSSEGSQASRIRYEHGTMSLGSGRKYNYIHF